MAGSLLNTARKDSKKYITASGWEEDITEIRDFDKLPENAKKYINRIEELIGIKIGYISVGPKREAAAGVCRLR